MRGKPPTWAKEAPRTPSGRPRRYHQMPRRRDTRRRRRICQRIPKRKATRRSRTPSSQVSSFLLTLPSPLFSHLPFPTFSPSPSLNSFYLYRDHTFSGKLILPQWQESTKSFTEVAAPSKDSQLDLNKNQQSQQLTRSNKNNIPLSWIVVESPSPGSSQKNRQKGVLVSLKRSPPFSALPPLSLPSSSFFLTLFQFWQVVAALPIKHYRVRQQKLGLPIMRYTNVFPTCSSSLFWHPSSLLSLYQYSLCNMSEHLLGAIYTCDYSE